MDTSLNSSYRKRLKLIGYWDPGTWNPKIPVKPDWPDIRRAVQPGWRLTDRQSLVYYLRSGTFVIGYLGSTYCRFGCCDQYSVLGSREYTDGEWVWPAGLYHYVERHAVILPDEFVASASARGWKASPVEQDRIWSRNPADYDVSFWLDWAKGLPDVPSGPSTADPDVMARFCLVLRFLDDLWPGERMDEFEEHIWDKVAEQFGVAMPVRTVSVGTGGDLMIEGVSVTNRDTVLALILSGLREYRLTDRVRLFCREPDPGDWQRSREVPVLP